MDHHLSQHSTSGGNYVLKFHAQQYETLKGSGGFDGISVSPRMEGSVYTLILSESDMARFKVNQDKINQPGDDSISVSLLASTSYKSKEFMIFFLIVLRWIRLVLFQSWIIFWVYVTS